MPWKRLASAPFLIPNADSAAPDAVTTPDILVENGRLVFYTGAVAADVERIIRFDLPGKSLRRSSPLPIPREAQVVLSPGPTAYDRAHVFDPAVIQWQGKIHLYYSAVGALADSIGLATSQDGIHFTKHPLPILAGRSPEVIVWQDSLYLFYVRELIGEGYSIFCARSQDGIKFTPVDESPVLTPGSSVQWDGFEVTTPRLFQRNGNFYMLYAACQSPSRKDLPDGFGLARSTDLRHWEKSDRNPVFSFGEPDSWDDGAVWFGTLFEWENDLYLVYEGGRLVNVQDKTPALTNVGLAIISLAEFDRMVAEW